MALITQEQYNEQRARYMGREINHQEFYLWLADGIGVTAADLPVSEEMLRGSTDEHFNDIPLAKWDNRHPTISQKAAGLSWSMSDTVCVLKAVARRLLQETEGMP